MAMASDFGELILERKNAAGVWFAALWPAAALLGAAGALALNARVPQVTLAATLFGLVGILMFAPLLLPGRLLRFHERGLIERLPFKADNPLRYDDIEHMTWRAVRPKVGVAINGELVAARRRIAFNAHVDTGGRYHQRMDGLRDRFAQYVAARAQRQILSSQAFAWGSQRGAKVRLQHDGIAYRPVGFLGAGEERLLPWGTPLDFVVRGGGLAVFSHESSGALFALACESHDFYPGFVVFLAMSRARERA